MSKSIIKQTRQPPAESKPNKQYDLFRTLYGDANNLSNTIELWDAIPKYSASARAQNKLRDSKGNLPVYEQQFEYRPTVEGLPDRIQCKVTIRPASIRNKDGSFTQYYPSTDEELVEEVLKKIFTDQNFGVHSVAPEESWVKFSLYKIQKELQARGKTRSLDEIKRSLEILSLATYELTLEGKTSGKADYTNTILSDMIRTTKSDYLEDPSSLWCARLPALVSKSINKLSYRQFNYAKLMSLPNQLSRWLHKRMSHQFVNASLLQPYNILYSSIERDSGLLHHSRKQRNIETVDTSLEHLREADVLMSFKKEEQRKGKTIVDIKYFLQPTMTFINEIKAANARQRDHLNELIRESPPRSKQLPIQ